MKKMAYQPKMKIIVVIPARFQSSRFPGKPLADIHGKPMIQHVYHRSCQATCTHRVIVATDDQRIADVVDGFGGEVMMTSPDHPSGTDRVVEVSQRVAADIYINVQGDEPLIRPGDIDLLAQSMLDDAFCKVATLCHPISIEEALDANKVKLIVSHTGNVLYFSRGLIPYSSHTAYQPEYLKHIGIYGFRAEVLDEYNKLPLSRLENQERLEQLRLLESDIPIRAVRTSQTGPGVDTPACLERVKQIMAREYSQDIELAN
jgi:3-deoxy-manno-octulosonate cytidylyltransferase (CMP-KDO synthetase)